MQLFKNKLFSHAEYVTNVAVKAAAVHYRCRVHVVHGAVCVCVAAVTMSHCWKRHSKRFTVWHNTLSHCLLTHEAQQWLPAQQHLHVGDESVPLQFFIKFWFCGNFSSWLWRFCPEHKNAAASGLLHWNSLLVSSLNKRIFKWKHQRFCWVWFHLPPLHPSGWLQRWWCARRPKIDPTTTRLTSGPSESPWSRWRRSSRPITRWTPWESCWK